MRGALRSYRWRRRLALGTGTLIFTAAFVVAAIALPKSHGKHYQLAPTGTGTPETFAEPERVRVTAAERREVNRTLVAFIRAGVTRADPAAAWELVTPAMRSGIPRSKWNAGDLPVVPFPADVPETPDWNILTSYPGDLTVDLLLQPRAGSRRGPIAFAVELKRTRDGRWLIDSMVPEHVFGAAPPPDAAAKPLPPNYKPKAPHGALSTIWFIVPASVLGLIVLVPLLVALNTWRRHRAIERRYRAERGI